MHVGSVLTRCLQLYTKAREAFLHVWSKGADGHSLPLAVQKVHLEGGDCNSKGVSRRNVCVFSWEVSI